MYNIPYGPCCEEYPLLYPGLFSSWQWMSMEISRIWFSFFGLSLDNWLAFLSNLGHIPAPEALAMGRAYGLQLSGAEYSSRWVNFYLCVRWVLLVRYGEYDYGVCAYMNSTNNYPIPPL